MALSPIQHNPPGGGVESDSHIPSRGRQKRSVAAVAPTVASAQACAAAQTQPSPPIFSQHCSLALRTWACCPPAGFPSALEHMNDEIPSLAEPNASWWFSVTPKHLIFSLGCACPNATYDTATNTVNLALDNRSCYPLLLPLCSGLGLGTCPGVSARLPSLGQMFVFNESSHHASFTAESGESHLNVGLNGQHWLMSH